MPRKKRKTLSFIEQMKKISAAKLSRNNRITDIVDESVNELETINERIKKLLNLTDSTKKRNDEMLFFVMYDIESNKVRRLVSKYLIRNGCTRVQRSLFLAKTDNETYEKIKSDLAAVQEAYENEDSIIILPVSTDYLRMMKVIGQKIEIDVITHSRNTLFF